MHEAIPEVAHIFSPTAQYTIFAEYVDSNLPLTLQRVTWHNGISLGRA